MTDTAAGLSSAEAARRLAADGPNDLPQDARRSLLRLIGDVVREPMFALLLAAAFIYALIGDRTEAAVLCGFALVSILITVLQQGRSQRVLDALRDLSSPRALVIRDGVALRIAGREVVRGDLLVLAEGDRIAADGQLVTASALQADESLLSGESLPVSKRSDGDAGQSQVFSGSMVVKGHGRARVTATGLHSEMGKIGVALRSTPLAVPSLQREVGRLVKVMGYAGLAVSLLVLLLLGALRGDWVAGLLGGISVGMSMLPEEFPLVLTVFMVMGAWRLSSSRVLARRASAIETLGAATVLCSDKTGTLTHNRISVLRLVQGSAHWAPTDGQTQLAAQASLVRLLRVAQGASDAGSFDPIDQAVLQLWPAPGTTGLALLRDYPLGASSPMLGRAWRVDGGEQLLLAVKGAPEVVLEACRLPVPERDAALAQVQALAAEGARVLAVAQATGPVSALPATMTQWPLQYLGLVAFADPLRESVPQAVRECRTAGIRIVMITGDNPHTAESIARRAGLADGQVLLGPELERLDAAQLAQRAAVTSVFARISPGQKLRIVAALQAAGEVVAMTGDGVNDAPALKAADIGVAMGARGSDVAREAAALVMLDDEFGALVGAVRIGRRIYDNLRKAMAYILAVHVPIAGLALLPLCFGWPMLLTPMIVALLEIIIDPACSIVLEAEPEEDNVMRRPPRDPGARLFSRERALWSLTQGLLALALLGLGLWWARSHGAAEERLRTITLLGLIGSNVVLIFINRSLGSAQSRLRLGGNVSFLVAVACVSLLVVAVSVSAPVQHFLKLGPPQQGDLGLCAGITALLLGLLLLVRRLRSPSASR